MASASDLQEIETFELLVGAAGADGYALTVTQSPAGEANAVCQLDPQDGELLVTLGEVADRNTDTDFLAGLGDYLFDKLFVGEIASLYRSSLNMVRAQERRLRVQLRIEPPELSALPWEFFHDAAEDAFLATSPETALVRFVLMRLPVRPSRVELPLRVLVVISQPHDMLRPGRLHRLGQLQARSDPAPPALHVGPKADWVRTLLIKRGDTRAEARYCLEGKA